MLKEKLAITTLTEIASNSRATVLANIKVIAVDPSLAANMQIS